MRTYIMAVLTVALVSAPALADGISNSVRTGSTQVHFHDGNVSVHSVKHGQNHHGHGPGFQPSTRPGHVTILPYPDHHGGHRHGQHCKWVPGHYETFYRQVWVPGHHEQRYVPAQYRKQIHNGVAYTVCVSEAYYAQVWVPGHYTTVTDRRWCEGYWTCHRH